MLLPTCWHCANTIIYKINPAYEKWEMSKDGKWGNMTMASYKIGGGYINYFLRIWGQPQIILGSLIEQDNFLCYNYFHVYLLLTYLSTNKLSLRKTFISYANTNQMSQIQMRKDNRKHGRNALLNQNCPIRKRCLVSRSSKNKTSTPT